MQKSPSKAQTSAQQESQLSGFHGSLMERTFASASEDWNERLQAGESTAGMVGHEDAIVSPARTRTRSSSSATGFLSQQQLQSPVRQPFSGGATSLTSAISVATSTTTSATTSVVPKVLIDIDDHDNLGDDRIRPALLRSLLNARPDLAMLLYECISDEGLAESSDREDSDQETSEI